MRFIKIFILPFIVLASMSFVQLNEQEDGKWVTEELNVYGNCGQCEARIENAALIKGVRMAEWDKYKQKLTIVYRPDKISSDEVLKAVAAVGHDSDKFKAPEKVYSELPKCCAYREAINVH